MERKLNCIYNLHIYFLKYLRLQWEPMGFGWVPQTGSRKMLLVLVISWGFLTALSLNKHKFDKFSDLRWEVSDMRLKRCPTALRCSPSVWVSAATPLCHCSFVASQKRLVSPSNAFDQQTGLKGTRHFTFAQLIILCELPRQWQSKCQSSQLSTTCLSFAFTDNIHLQGQSTESLHCAWL